MSNIVVPDFHSDADFQRWVAKLSEKEIRSWRAKDWNIMFEKLDRYVQNNKMLRFKCRFHNFFNSSKAYMPAAMFMTRNSRNVAALTKLYLNFRLEPTQFDIIRRTARQAGQFLAMKPDIRLEKIALMSHIKSHAEYEKVAQLASDIVLQQSEYEPQYKERMAAKLEFSQKQGFGGVAHLRDTKYPMEVIQPTIYYGYGGDSFAELMFHESAHAYLQTGTVMQEKLAARGIRPLAEMDKDFYRLMQYNYTFYLPSEGVFKSLRNYFKHNDGLQKYDDAAMFMKGYQRQPVEKYSYIYGMEAERAYRHDKKQLSERGALSLLQVLGVTCGYPCDVDYQDNGLTLKYKTSLFSSAEMLKRAEFMLDKFPSEIKKSLKLRINEQDEMVLEVPKGQQFKNAIDSYRNKVLQDNNKTFLAYKRLVAAQKVDAVTGLNLSAVKIPQPLKNLEAAVSLKINRAINIYRERH